MFNVMENWTHEDTTSSFKKEVASFPTEIEAEEKLLELKSANKAEDCVWFTIESDTDPDDPEHNCDVHPSHIPH